MKLEKWLKYVDPISFVVIWISDDDEAPVFEGSILDIPWWLTKLKIGRADGDIEEPIRLSEDLGEEYNHRPGFVINLIS